jgi:hypothetical protein
MVDRTCAHKIIGFLMEKNHRLGRTGAGARVVRRAHARKLLLVLSAICRHLYAKQTNPEVRAAYREVERKLERLRSRPRRPANRRNS